MISSTSFYLHSIYPNPFNPIARIPISMIDPDFIDISIYDLRGRLVERWNTFLEIGSHDLTWDANELPSGIYFIQVKSKEFYVSQKAILLR